MSNLLEYYRKYYDNNGLYKLQDYKGSSRHLMIEKWLKENAEPGAQILDIGCGDGSYAKWMPEFKWTGVDINTKYEEEYSGDFFQLNIESTPYHFFTGKFDAVICSEVLEHLFSPEKVHEEVNRVLRPKGVYIVSTPNYDWIEHHLGMFRQILYSPVQSHLKEHIRFYNFEVHQQMLDKAGFTVADCMGADIQFSKFFETCRKMLTVDLPDQSIGEIDYRIGRMFPLVQHTIGILGVKR